MTTSAARYVAPAVERRSPVDATLIGFVHSDAGAFAGSPS